jgi:hypothetical protein
MDKSVKEFDKDPTILRSNQWLMIYSAFNILRSSSI